MSRSRRSSERDGHKKAWQRAIAAEVSSRYGVTVKPDVVQRVAQGVSGLDPSAGLHWKKSSIAGVKAYHRGQRLKNAANAEAAQLSSANLMVRAMHSEGKTAAEIAVALGVTKSGAQKRIERLGLSTPKGKRSTDGA